MKLQGKVALITGGAIGIGAATARLFAQEGAEIALTDVDVVRGEETCRQIREAGGVCRFYEMDVSNAQQVARVIPQIIQDFKRVDILVNNAAIWRPGRVTDLDEETWDRVLDTNLKGIFLVSKYVLPVMMEAKHGVVINVASVAGLVGAPDASAYAASKGGVVNLSRSMALDFAPYNIRVNCLCPGLTDTAQGDSVVKHYKPTMDPTEAKRTWQPLQRVGTAEDMAKAALYIASDDAEFMTGSIFVIDGGLIAQ
ncbi:MAG: SDR family oxidoreductase [Anaerolineae bacterium]|nr:SDR family oxidoreductase [Anaerolineae bacterium]MDW8071556.1 SDR family NAD(P)-dependent oxidoreductase [Anaerolineae bacterium]